MNIVYNKHYITNAIAKCNNIQLHIEEEQNEVEKKWFVFVFVFVKKNLTYPCTEFLQ